MVENSILCAQFPVLHLLSAHTCCCADLLAPYASLTNSSFTNAATKYCAGVQNNDPSYDCSKDIVSSVIIPLDEDCIPAVARGLESRFTYSVASGELGAVDIRVNDEDLQFVLPRYYQDMNETIIWAEAFCAFHNIEPISPCVDYLFSSIGEAFLQPLPPPPPPPLPPQPPPSCPLEAPLETPLTNILLHHYHSFAPDNKSQPESSYAGEMKREFEMIRSGIDELSHVRRVQSVSNDPVLVICMLPTEIVDGLPYFWWCPTLPDYPNIPHAILDMADRPVMSDFVFSLRHYRNVIMFKRSTVIKSFGRVLHSDPDYLSSDWIHPISLSALPGYVTSEDEQKFDSFKERAFIVSNTLRPSSYARARSLDMTTRAVRELNLSNAEVFLGQLDDMVRSEVNEKYVDLLSRSKIIVTANPGGWEGDHRTFEALSSGGLVFVDRMYGVGLVDGVHCIFYDLDDYDGFKRKIEHFIKDEQGIFDAHVIAKNGKEFVRKHHSSGARVEEILRVSKI